MAGGGPRCLDCRVIHYAQAGHIMTVSHISTPVKPNRPIKALKALKALKPVKIEAAPKPVTAKPAKAADPLKLAGLKAVIDDARVAALSSRKGPADPIAYAAFLQRLQAVAGKFPPLYAQKFVQPFIATVKQLGAHNFARVLDSDPERESSAGLMFDLGQAILQRGEGHLRDETRAVQEFISDLYDGFLSAADRRGVKQPDLGVIPPLAKWGNPEAGPYTWPIDAAESFGVAAAVVSMPPANADRGLVAWAALGHETAGHDILHADIGLQAELAEMLRTHLAPLGHGLAEYWADRIDETSSDVMGILNLGPAAGIGLIAYFRGLSAAFGDEPVLRSDGPADDPHPADIVRGYLAAEVVALLSFAGHSAWSKVIAAETDKDRRTIVLAGEPVSAALARKSARIVARTLVRGKAASLEHHALGDIQGWADSDEAILQAMRAPLRNGTPLPPTPNGKKLYAAHLVSAAVMEALATGQQIGVIQANLVQALSKLHERNPSWGPLFVVHPGQMSRDYFGPRPSRVLRRAALEA